MPVGVGGRAPHTRTLRATARASEEGRWPWFGRGAPGARCQGWSATRGSRESDRHASTLLEGSTCRRGTALPPRARSYRASIRLTLPRIPTRRRRRPGPRAFPGAGGRPHLVDIRLYPGMPQTAPGPTTGPAPTGRHPRLPNPRPAASDKPHAAWQARARAAPRPDARVRQHTRGSNGTASRIAVRGTSARRREHKRPTSSTGRRAPPGPRFRTIGEAT